MAGGGAGGDAPDASAWAGASAVSPATQASNDEAGRIMVEFGKNLKSRPSLPGLGSPFAQPRSHQTSTGSKLLPVLVHRIVPRI